MRAAIDKGLKPTNHTDFVVAPLDQMFVIWTAVNRISRTGVVIGPDQRVTPMEASEGDHHQRRDISTRKKNPRVRSNRASSPTS